MTVDGHGGGDAASHAASSTQTPRRLLAPLAPLNVHTRSPSNISAFTSHRSIVSTGDASTQLEAEVISRATTQAISAARSILLSGGTQSSALFTATAAAQSVLLPKSMGGEKPPLVPGSKGFFGRRKNLRQAEVIASVALVSVNSALQTPRGFDGQIESPLHRDMILHGPYSNSVAGVFSEFTDDPASPRSEALPSHSNASLRRGPRTSFDANGFLKPIHESSLSVTSPSTAPTPELPVQPERPSPTIHVVTSMSQPSSSISVSPKKSTSDQHRTRGAGAALTPTVADDESKDDMRPQPAPKKVSEPVSFLDYFMKKQARADETSSPKSSIPEEMPKNRAKVDRSKGDMTFGNAAKDDPIYETAARPQSPSNRNVLDQHSDGSTTSDSSNSKTNLTPEGSESAYESNTTSEHSEEDEGTLETLTVAHEEDGTVLPKGADEEDEGSYFPSVDPLITSFNDVFSCGPDAKSPWSNAEQKRDANDTTRPFFNESKEPRERPNQIYAVPGQSLKNSDSDLLLQDLRSAEEASARRSKKKASHVSAKKTPTANNANPSAKATSIEHVVMRALTSLPKSPPSRPAATSSRPSLHLDQRSARIAAIAATAAAAAAAANDSSSSPRAAGNNTATSSSSLSPAKQRAAAAKILRDNSMSAYSTVQPSHNPTIISSLGSKSKPPPTVVAPMSSSSMSGFEPPGSSSSSEQAAANTATVVVATPTKKQTKLPWFRRNKKEVE